MAIGTPVLHAASGETGGTHTTASFTPGGRNILIVAVHCYNATGIPAFPTISGGSLTWRQISGQSFDTGANPRLRQLTFWARVPPSPSSMTVTVESVGASSIGAHVTEWSGLSPDFTDFGAATSTTGDPAPAVASVFPGSGVLAFGTFVGGSSYTISGFTELHDNIMLTSRRIGAAYDLTSPGTSVPFVSNNSNSIGSAIELREAGVGLQDFVTEYITTIDSSSPVSSDPLTILEGKTVFVIAANERSDANPSQPALTDTAGWTWTERFDLIYATAADPRMRVTIWTAVSDGNANTITLTQGTSTALGLVVLSIENAEPVPTNFVNSRLAGGSASLSFGTVPPLHATAAFLFGSHNQPFDLLTGGMTELIDIDNNGVQRLAFYFDRTSPESSASWDSDNGFVFAVGFRVKELGAGPTSGSTVSASSSFVPGSASGEDGTQDGDASGATNTSPRSVVAGTASGERTGSAAGATLSSPRSVVAGTASGERTGAAEGETITSPRSVVAGTASGERTGAAEGETITSPRSVVAGTASGEQTGAATGVTFSSPRSVVAGTALGERTGAATGATLSSPRSVVAGTALGVRFGEGSGAIISISTSVVEGEATGERTGEALGASLSRSSTLLEGAADGGSGAGASGATVLSLSSLLPGVAEGSENAEATGAILLSSSSLLAGEASAERFGEALGAILSVDLLLSPGIAFGGGIPDTAEVVVGSLVRSILVTGRLPPGRVASLPVNDKSIARGELPPGRVASLPVNDESTVSGELP
jgi:hypothetical protein